ncbi:MAG: hypothetical protein ACTFAL_09250 [Candidatus Electronema sp. V4]
MGQSPVKGSWGHDVGYTKFAAKNKPEDGVARRKRAAAGDSV